MRTLTLFLIINVCLLQIAIAQNTGSGSISNYTIFCNPSGSCIDNSSIEQEHTITATADGTMKVTVNLMPETVECCDGLMFPQNIVGVLQTEMKNSTLGTFTTNTSDTREYTCVQEGDIFKLTFGGEKGMYDYNVTMVPPTYSIDPEPNNMIGSAMPIAVNSATEGHIGFGKYSNQDNSDWYRLDVPKDGELIFTSAFDGPMNYYLRKYTNGNQAVKTSLHAAADTITLDNMCFAEGDSLLLNIVGRSNVCGSYSFSYMINETPGENDVEPNNDQGSASLIANIPGAINGHIGHGITLKDGVDYFILGELELNDSLHFNFNVTGDPVQFRIHRLSGFPFKDFGNIDGATQSDYSITQAGLYFFQALGGNCSSYTVNIAGRISNQRIDGVDALKAADALGRIDVSNSTAGPGTSVLCAPCVTLCPLFDVPNGVEFSIIPK